jgi:hypothetical protein
MNLKDHSPKPKLLCPLMCWEFVSKPSIQLSETSKRIKNRVKMTKHEDQPTTDPTAKIG